MELHIEAPEDPVQRLDLMFNPRFHEVDRLLEAIEPGVLPYQEIADLAPIIQASVSASDTLQRYALDLWEATRNPKAYGVSIGALDMEQLILAGASARGVSMMMRAARVAAWLDDRDYLIPEDIRGVFRETTAHRVFFQPVYELRRSDLIGELMTGILDKVSAP
jgi:MoxR-like ATPase